MSATICIPARLHSERLDSKVLLAETGEPLIRHTVRAAANSKLARRLIVTTDSLDVANAVSVLCPSYVETLKHWCGTSRVASAMQVMSEFFDYPVVVNLQADEPCIKGGDLDNLIREVLHSAEISTLIAPLPDELIDDRNTVKVLVDNNGFASSFVREYKPIMGPAYAHVGAYAFAKETLRKLGEMPPSESSKAHDLEQLTWLDAGYRIRAVKAKELPLAINTREDYDRFVAQMEQLGIC